MITIAVSYFNTETPELAETEMYIAGYCMSKLIPQSSKKIQAARNCERELYAE